MTARLCGAGENGARGTDASAVGRLWQGIRRLERDMVHNGQVLDSYIRADTTLEGSRREAGTGAGAFAPETSCIWAAMACHDLHCISPVVRSGLPLQPPPVVRSLFVRDG